MSKPFAENTTVAEIAEANIAVTKGFFGWRAETMVHIDHGQTLEIVTMKRSSGALITTVIAGVYVPPREPGGLSSFSYEPFGTYNVRALAVSGVRVTSKAVAEQHGKVLADLARHINAANKFKR